jgi:hypothetical protein
MFSAQHNGTAGTITTDWGEIQISIKMALIIKVIMDVTTPTLTTDKFATIIVVINGTQISIIISDPGNYIHSVKREF